MGIGSQACQHYRKPRMALRMWATLKTRRTLEMGFGKLCDCMYIYIKAYRSVWSLSHIYIPSAYEVGIVPTPLKLVQQVS